MPPNTAALARRSCRAQHWWSAICTRNAEAGISAAGKGERMTTATKERTLPGQAIRRVDGFAKSPRQERREQGDPADEAKGYGIWLAKVVASRRFGAKSDEHDRHGG